MADFVAAAARIKTIHMRCEDLLEAARADSLLASTKAVTKLTAEGPVLPSHHPPTVTELRLNIGQYCCSDEDETGEVWDSMLVDSLLFRASQLAQLHTLSVALTALSIKDIQFTCPVHLLGLQHLSIEFWISDNTVIDLGWVHQQACPRLDLQIWVQTSDFEVHAAVVQQLGQLTVSSLEMEVRADFPAALQILWASLTIAKSSWYFRYECTFSQGSGALQALPAGQASCVLRLWNSHASKAVHLSWQALAACAAKVTIGLEFEMELWVVGAPNPAFCHLQDPWQLVINSTGCVHGFPASQPTSKRWFLQNDAAKAAGWVESHSPDLYPTRS